MTPLVLLRAAQADIRKAALFYKRQAKHLATEFTAERFSMDRLTMLMTSALVVGACAPSTAQSQTGPVLPQCFEIRISDPDALFMLDADRDTLVLTERVITGFGRADGRLRAFVGAAEWRANPPVTPSSWQWSEQGVDSVRVSFVLPISSVVWSARRVQNNLVGKITYQSDVVGELEKSSDFTAERISCS